MWPPHFNYPAREGIANTRHGHGESARPGKVKKVLHEFKEGTLKSSSGAKVTARKQAVAIAMSEAGLSRPRKKR